MKSSTIKIILMVISYMAVTGGAFYGGKIYQERSIVAKLIAAPIKLAGLELNNDTNTYDSSTFSCYPFRGDGNCSKQIMENYQKIDTLAGSKCNVQLKNNVMVVQPKPRIGGSSSSCYTDPLGTFHCNSFNY